MNFKEIHIGKYIHRAVEESEISIERICNFMKCTESEIEEMYQSENLSTHVLLRWSKLLEYDFFRIYTQHLILYAPPKREEHQQKTKLVSLPQFRKKHLYTGNYPIYFGKNRK